MKALTPKQIAALRRAVEEYSHTLGLHTGGPYEAEVTRSIQEAKRALESLIELNKEVQKCVD